MPKTTERILMKITLRHNQDIPTTVKLSGIQLIIPK